MKSLQSQFLESRGRPVEVDGLVVRQSDRIPIHKGRVRITFRDGQTEDQGLCLKANEGWILLSDGRRVESVNIWRSRSLSDSVEHEVFSPRGVHLWNIYRIRHSNGSITEDKWTGNAGLVLLGEHQNTRLYGCSDGLGEFSPEDLVVEVCWLPSTT